MRTLLLSLLTLLGTRAVVAQDYSTDALERRAVRLGVLATAIPVVAGTVLVVTSQDDGPPILIAEIGLVFGPALGYTEAGLSGRGWRAAGLRAGLAFASLMGAVAICWDCTADQERTAWMVLIGGNVLVATSAIYDLARLPHNIRRHEAQRRIGIAPFYRPGEQRVGLLAQVSF
ncbi:MAG TPA: hypothetical protein VKD28_02740 [Gemmatimonadales bacterium]|nr:hypothetical protein [Gemmatimonadales bacterium]